MNQYRGEVHRNLISVEAREELEFDLEITDDAYRSQHDLTGGILGTVAPDADTVRARQHPPTSALGEVIDAVTGEPAAVGASYPGTDLFVGMTRVPPLTQGDPNESLDQQVFDIRGIPDNGTIEISTVWDPDEAESALAEGERKRLTHEYEIDGFPGEQLPIVVRAELERDAREYFETNVDAEGFERSFGDLGRYEGLAVLSIIVEYREDAPEVQRGGGGRLTIENFRAEMGSTFNDIEFLSSSHGNGDYTYNPEQKQIEWRRLNAMPGESIRYEVIGPVRQLLELGHISASFQGEISGTTLTGTNIAGLFDRTGRRIDDDPDLDLSADHRVRLTGSVEIDPRALEGDTRNVTDASVSVRDTPFETFDRLEAICRREAMQIREISPPSDPEPISNKENVFEITASEKDKGEDDPGILKIKREYGNRGVVYADLEVTGRFTSMTEQSEVSAADNDRLVRSDSGGLGERGKSTVVIKARSADSELNAELINTLKGQLTAQGSRTDTGTEGGAADGEEVRIESASGPPLPEEDAGVGDISGQGGEPDE